MADEKTFENKIKRYLVSQGIYYFKFFANRMTRAGIPDLICCVNGYFVGIEVKAQTGKPSELQLYNVEEIRKSGGFCVVVYPSGYDKLVKFIEDLKVGIYNREMEVILK